MASADLVALQLVPGHGGVTALLYLAIAATLAGFAAAAAAGRARQIAERVVVGGVVFIVALVGLTRLPAEFKSRKAEFSANRGLSYREGEAQAQAAAGIDPGFIAFLAERLPMQRFSMRTGPTITTSGPQSWAEFELLPRLEDYNDLCRGTWIVFVASPPELPGVKLGRPVTTYKPGYSFARNLTPCT